MTVREWCSSLSASLEGIDIASPPSRAGRAYRSHLTLFGGGLPVMAGISLVRSVLSSGTNRWLKLGTTRLRYVHLLRRPWVMAE